MAIADIFLKYTGSKAGWIKGEATDADHTEEIEVASWNWGAEGGGYGAAAGSRRTYAPLEIVKYVDRASTGLLSCLSSNDVGKSAVLTVRKAGKDPAEFLKITLEKVRVASVQLECQGTELTERIRLVYQKVTVDYTVIKPDGLKGGGMSFIDEVAS